jgi:hypothetical protein
LPPASFHDFLNEVTRLFHLIRKHPSFVAAVRMNRRSIRKMATVARMEGEGPYIQTGLVQRGLGFAWRLHDMGGNVEEVRHYFRLMPVSIGVAVANAPESVLLERNKAREMVRETAHENRSFQVPHMIAVMPFCLDCLEGRVPVAYIDTTQSRDEARAELVAFAGQNSDRAPPSTDGHCGAPVWW